ncbi:response regulator transcription factor [Gloeocapsopsis sp. IPPAS B-1203]|uniref:response regulator n=1 Tax=Gloeocapsopsis sp. IPPAS B-1203 TaxID=2049454 RepID=UPI000C19441C|nr:response regulator transcription factor [Gloeocapsopsis sp. IPPAS B-1203]PIG91648.1 DNA-binding response regulator [Gloeocapsopsis sp. IPPAS B-1203]
MNPEPQPLWILIADDHPVVRDGLAAILNKQPGMTVIAQAGNGLEAVEQFRLHQPDVAIVDLRMPEMGGAEVVATVRAEFPNACFIMLTVYDGDEDIYQGFRAGAKAYLLKDTPCHELVEVIRAVCAGAQHIPNSLTSKLASRLSMSELSDRERQVLTLMTDGKNNREIGEAIGISESTVRFHVSNLMSKLGVSDRTHAVVTALKRGIIKL